MAYFTKKTWKDRLVEFAGRRTLKNVGTNESVTYDVTRAEGTVSQEGDAFSPANMNGMEQRIADGFSAAEAANNQLNSEMASMKTSFQAGVDTLYNKCSSCGATPSAKTPTAVSTAIQKIYTDRYNAGYNAGSASLRSGKCVVEVTSTWENNQNYHYITVKINNKEYISGWQINATSGGNKSFDFQL